MSLLSCSNLGVAIGGKSILSDVSMPVQGTYSAAKHAVKGFTNALRLELLRNAPQVSVTLIKPSAMDTPYKLHARNYTGRPASLPPPVYDPALAAEAILYAAETPTREITVGGTGRLLALFSQLAPAIADPLFAWAIPLLSREKRDDEEADNLFQPARDGQERAGGFPFVRRTSLYTRAQLNPATTAAALAGVAIALIASLSVRDQLRLAQARRAGRHQERARHARRQSSNRGT